MQSTTERRRTRATIFGPALVVGLAVCLVGPPVSFAQVARGGAGGAEMHGGTDNARPGGSWHGNIGEWHGGRWYQGWHGNRYGWWWAVPGYDWYAYDEPAYPYPAYPYTGYPGAPVAPYYWYYCQNPVGYYPYVQQCAGPWQPVPAPG
jgi:hypothetical protein